MRFAAFQAGALSHIHHAMVLTVAAATRWQVRFARGSQRHERSDERQAEHGQQRDGNKLAQCRYSIML